VAAIVYEDRWGEVIDRPTLDIVELRWFDSTREMSRDDFNESLTRFAACVEQTGRHRVLIDSTSFRMSPSNMDGPWRDEHIIPRYNSAGVVKFAFHMPEGMPMIGAAPEREGPGRFPTGYFGRRVDAIDWLTRE
jgi:hypothetical protein